MFHGSLVPCAERRIIRMDINMEMSTERKMEYYRKLLQFYRKYKAVSEDLDWEWSFEDKQ